MNQRSFGLSSRPWAWVGIFALALLLRFYHLTGWILNYDEAHWLYYSQNLSLLFQTQRSSHARPDALLAWLTALTARLVGPNELALRFWPALCGALSVFPLGKFVGDWTDNRAAGFTAALLLAVLPLHVYLSAQGLPDVMALFFFLCALVGFVQLVQQPASASVCAWLGACLALSLLSKATALWLWLFLGLISPLFLPRQALWPRFYGCWLVALLPLGALVALIRAHGSALTFVQEPVWIAHFGFHPERLRQHLDLFVRFFNLIMLAAAAGLWAIWKRQRAWFVWAAPLLLVVITPFFRSNIRELLYVIASILLLAALGLELIQNLPARVAAVATLTAICLGLSLFGVPIPPLGASVSDRTSAVLDRPAGWPSRQASHWLLTHTSPDETILVVSFTFTDPLLLALQSQRRIFGAWLNWELLREPANKVKYAVFLDDATTYAPSFLRFAQSHFTSAARFPNYVIYDCRKDNHFVAYLDAFNSPDTYLRHGKILFQEGKFGEAIKAFETALQADPNSLTARIELVPAYLALGRKDDALRLGLEILRREPKEPQTNHNLALLYLEMGRVEEGIAQCEKNIRWGILPAVNYGVLGQLREKQGDFAAALTAYKQSLTLDPQNTVTQNLLANLRAKMQQTPAKP